MSARRPCERMSMTGYPHPNDISAPRVPIPHEHLTLTRGHVSVDFDLRTLPDRVGPLPQNEWVERTGRGSGLPTLVGRSYSYLPSCKHTYLLERAHPTRGCADREGDFSQQLYSSTPSTPSTLYNPSTYSTPVCAESSAAYGRTGRHRLLLGRFRHHQWVTGDARGGRAVHCSSAYSREVRCAECCAERCCWERPSSDRQG